MRNIGSQIRNNDGYAINNGVFAHTLLVGTDQHALYHGVVGLLGDKSEVKRRVASSVLPATRAERLEFFKMKKLDEPTLQSANHYGGTTWR